MVAEPYYMLQFTTAACLFEIRVNDNPLMTTDIKNGGLSTQIPINNGIPNTGPLEISIKLLPSSGNINLSQDCYFDYTLVLVEAANNEFSVVEYLGAYRSKRLEKDEKKVIIAHSELYAANVPYEMKTPWVEGRRIDKIRNATEELRKAYNRVLSLIENREFHTYQTMIADREHNIKVSMYLTEQESEARFEQLRRDLQGSYNVAEFPETAIMVVSAYGRKASLKRLNGDPALSFGSIEKKEQIMLDIEFYWSKTTGQFEII